MKGIVQALREGCRLHAFLSGGGLRVVSLECDEESKGYGEHPNIEEALRIASDDFQAGVRPYGSVYGPIETHYLTGSSEPSSPLDAWLLCGQKLDAWHDQEGFVVELKGYEEQQYPENIQERNMIAPVEWEARGFRFRSTSAPLYQDGPLAVSTKTIQCPPGVPEHFDFFYPVVKRGVGSNWGSAMKQALDAPAVPTDH